MWLTCTLGPYNLDFMTDVTQEIVEMYDVGGIFSNRWTGNGMCFCEHCVHDFRQAYNEDLPHNRDPRNPVYRHYLSMGAGSSLRDLGNVGTRSFAKLAPTPATSPTPAAALSAAST